MLPDEEILSVIRSKEKKPLKDIAEGLIDAANRQGGRDNITVVMVKLTP
jgi:serine/threonine protein phosphatase PrpC